MCYVVLLGTDSTENLSVHDGCGVNFNRAADGQSGSDLLRLPERWTVDVGSCSCDLRHLMPASVDLGFSEPADWWPEEDEHIAATRHVIAVIRSLVAAGSSVECIDLWNGQVDGELVTLDVDLAGIPDAAFRFFESHRFVFRGPGDDQPQQLVRGASTGE